MTANAPAKHEHFHELKIFSKDKTIVHSKLDLILHGSNTKLIKSNYPDKENRKNLIRNFIDSLLEKTEYLFKYKRSIYHVSLFCYREIYYFKKNKNKLF